MANFPVPLGGGKKSTSKKLKLPGAPKQRSLANPAKNMASGMRTGMNSGSGMRMGLGTKRY